MECELLLASCNCFRFWVWARHKVESAAAAAAGAREGWRTGLTRNWECLSRCLSSGLLNAAQLHHHSQQFITLCH